MSVGGSSSSNDEKTFFMNNFLSANDERFNFALIKMQCQTSNGIPTFYHDRGHFSASHLNRRWRVACT
jgi:hypothetical protein